MYIDVNRINENLHKLPWDCGFFVCVFFFFFSLYKVVILIFFQWKSWLFSFGMDMDSERNRGQLVTAVTCLKSAPWGACVVGAL